MILNNVHDIETREDRAKLRQLRMHYNSDGSPKTGLTKKQAEASCYHRNKKFHVHYQSYLCKMCGEYHVGTKHK